MISQGGDRIQTGDILQPEGRLYRAKMLYGVETHSRVETI